MNRIVLIGNGFDLAHGLPTRYIDFINWYWDECVNELRKCSLDKWSNKLCSFTIRDRNIRKASFLFCGGIFYARPGTEIINDIIENHRDSIYITFSPLFERITKSIKNRGWVDIENEYYSLLSSLPESEDNKRAKELNDELDYLRLLLAEYLNTVQTEANQKKIINPSIWNVLLEPIRPEEIAISAAGLLDNFIEERIKLVEWESFLQSWNEELTTLDYLSSLRGIQEDYSKEGVEGLRNQILWEKFLLPDKMLLLNFNYTSIADDYLSWDKKKHHLINHIHGQLSYPDGMIFGYGDELDSGYKGILQRNNNEYLRNIKSIKYLETDNYRNMLAFIESAPYQIFIMGHSCGNSDRTLLNTLFEHRNCVSIKPYYYKREDETDTYMDIIQNISRNFTDMKLMRDRVVNKQFCEPLPQSTSKKE